MSLSARSASDSTLIVQSLADMFPARMFAIARGYEDADDLDFLHYGPRFKLASDGCPTRP